METNFSNYYPATCNFLTEAGQVTIIPENINLVPQRFLNEYTYIFKVVCRKICNSDVVFKVNIVASFVDRKWILLMFNNYSVYTQRREDILIIHEILHFEIFKYLEMFDNIFVNTQKIINELNFNGDKVGIKTIRKTAKGCYVRFSVGDKIRNSNKLYGTFKIDDSNIHYPRFILDSFEYDEINIQISDFIDNFGSQFRLFLDANINYVRVM